MGPEDGCPCSPWWRLLGSTLLSRVQGGEARKGSLLYELFVHFTLAVLQLSSALVCPTERQLGRLDFPNPTKMTSAVCSGFCSPELCGEVAAESHRPWGLSCPRLDVVVHICNPSAGGWQGGTRSGPFNKTQSPNRKVTEGWGYIYLSVKALGSPLKNPPQRPLSLRALVLPQPAPSPACPPAAPRRGELESLGVMVWSPLSVASGLLLRWAARR